MINYFTDTKLEQECACANMTGCDFTVYKAVMIASLCTTTLMLLILVSVITCICIHHQNSSE